MPKASHIRSSFNAGELTPMLDGRVDLAKYGSGCRVMENFTPSIQGPAVRRAGTRYVSEVKNSSNRTWLVSFEFSATQAFVLEFGDYYIRFYNNHAQVQSGGSPYEIVSPYSASDLTDATTGTFRLSMAQSNDVIYIAHPSYPLKKLARYSTTNWTLTDTLLVNGPLKTQNTDKTVTVYASATTGSVTLTASSSIFTSSHVGSLFYLEPKDLAAILPWTAGQEYWAAPYGQRRRSDGKTYTCVTAGAPASGYVWRTGGDKPIHTYGTAADGDGSPRVGTQVTREGLDWTYIDSGYGLLKITGYTSGTSVTATVVSDWPLPTNVVSSTYATFRWAFGSFSPAEGYPSHVTFFRERLTLAKGQNIYFSVAGDFENFASKDDSGQVVADRAIQVELSSDQANNVTWLSPSQSLLIGTQGNEFACSENSTSEAFAPGNVKIEQQTSEGCRSVAPVRVGYSTLFVQRSGRKLKEMAYNFQQNGFISADLSALAEHITKGGITQMAWHKEPYVALWGVRGDGQLLGFTFNKEQDVVGWHRHIIGGSYGSGDAVVESVCVIPNPLADRDDLWLIVKRTINGTTKRYVEYLEREYQTGDAQSSAFYVDAGYTSDTTNTTVATMTVTSPTYTLECYLSWYGSPDYLMAIPTASSGLSLNGLSVVGDDIPAGTVITSDPIYDPWYDLWYVNTNNLLPYTESFQRVDFYNGTSIYTAGTNLRLQCSSAVFAYPEATNIGDVVLVTDSNGDEYKLTIVELSFVYTPLRTTTVVSVQCDVDLPASLQATATSIWSIKKSIISGLSHLEGQTVQVLADGAAHPNRTVTSGAITLQFPAIVAQIGLGYESTLQTNRIEAGAADGTAQGKTKRINKCVVRFYNTLGAKAGPDENNLDEIQFRTGSDPMNAPPPIFTGDKLLEWPGGYDFDGYVMVKQDQPLPMTVVAVMPQVTTFDRQ